MYIINKYSIMIQKLFQLHLVFYKALDMNKGLHTFVIPPLSHFLSPVFFISLFINRVVIDRRTESESWY